MNKQLMISINSEIAKLLELEFISSPWAILLVQFSDQKDAWPPLSKYQELFTSAGSGKMNMLDFFSDISHGKLDLSGSKIFGPYTLSAKRSDYIGNAPAQTGKLTRGDLLNLARSTATAAGVNLNAFSGVCVSCLGQVDLCGWVGGMAALCDTLSLEPSALGQEMGHGYGLDHARLYGSTADYQDPWDVMSTYNAYMESNPDFTLVGPAMNAWNMRGRGWLDETRVWTTAADALDEVVQLRPLHRTDLPGFLAAQVGQYLVEFRVPQKWDAAIPRACILVHSFQDNHSYLMPAHSGSKDIVEGDKFVFGDPNLTQFIGYYAAEVVKIDEANLTATVKLHQRLPHPPKLPGLVGQVFGGPPVDGEGIIIIGGQVIKIPPRGPARELVESFARYLRIDISSNNVGVALAGQRAALETTVSNVLGLYAEAKEISEQPPGYLNHGPSRKIK